MRSFLVFALMTLLVGGAAFYLTRMRSTRPTAARVSCIHNLRQIEGAKEQWKLVTNATNGQPADTTAIVGYIKGGLPVCDQGGSYTFNAVGQLPTCSIATHRYR